MLVTMIKSDPKAREKPCLRCGYSLRRLTDTNYCPECGLSLWLSLNNNDTLEMSNPDWLRRMAVGLWVMAAASVVLAAVLWPPTLDEFRLMRYHQAITAAIREASMTDSTPNLSAVFALRPARPDPGLELTLTVIGGAAFAVYLLGLALLTSSENRYPDRLAGYRAGARATGVVAGLGLLLMLMQATRATPPLGFPVWLTRLAAIAAATLTWAHLAAVARRMPNKRLVRVCTWMLIAAIVSLAYSFIRNSDWMPNLIPLIFLPVGIALMTWVARLLRQAATVADRNWTAETQPSGSSPAAPASAAQGSSPMSAKT